MASDLVTKLKQNIASAKTDLESLERGLETIQKSCQHLWTVVKYDPIIHKAYRIHGDAPGTMGVDWQGPMDVPEKEVPRWTRECKLCGLEQATTTTRDDVRKVPVF